ncbi:MAG: hypothetical protein ACE5FG_08575 [Myxococcota bacterium]
MREQDPGLPEELARALEDLRQIREVVDRVRAHHPVRMVARPWLGLCVVVGVIVVAFGVGAQLALDYGGESVLGLSPVGFVWVLGAVLAVGLQIAKLMVIDAASRRVGYDLSAVLRSVFTADYVRIVLPGALLLLLGSLGLHSVDGDDLILGFVLAGVGALLIPLSGAIALPECSIFGVLLLIGGGLAMFTFPEWPFYKLAAVWGGTLILGALLLRPRLTAPAR